jgi:hypothetical protein
MIRVEAVPVWLSETDSFFATLGRWMTDGTFANPERASKDIVPFVSSARTAAGSKLITLKF